MKRLTKDEIQAVWDRTVGHDSGGMIDFPALCRGIESAALMKAAELCEAPSECIDEVTRFDCAKSIRELALTPNA